jgi:D-alanyl-D-alanine carboxypeptidase (penicillin-binding protein 5/6)
MDSVDKSLINKELTIAENIQAPVTEGDVLGSLKYTYEGKELGTVDITAKETVEKAGYKDALLKALKKLTAVNA